MTPTIDTIETIPLRSELDEGFGYAQSWVRERTALLVRIEANDGTVGWGECWGPIAGTHETIERFLAPHVEGRNPLNVERIYDDLYNQGRAAYQSIVPLPAISGIDIALWDLAGKLCDRSVSSLLNGSRRSSVRPYATGHYFKEGAELDEQYRRIANEAERNAERFGAVKAKIGLDFLGHGPNEDIKLVQHIRDAIGPETTLMVDANYAYDIGTARYIGRELEDLDVYWFEEPIPPENMQGYCALRNALDIRIAGGECHTFHELEHLFDHGGLDVAQPDVCNIGGLTTARRVASQASAHNVQVTPHVWGTPIAIAASLHLISTLTGRPWLEFDCSSNPLRAEIMTGSFDFTEDGNVHVPEGPGLGIDLNPEVLTKYRID